MRTTFTIGVIFAFMAVIAAGHNVPAMVVAGLFATGFLAASAGIALNHYLEP